MGSNWSVVSISREREEKVEKMELTCGTRSAVRERGKSWAGLVWVGLGPGHGPVWLIPLLFLFCFLFLLKSDFCFKL
jgi:hypothetical protein